MKTLLTFIVFTVVMLLAACGDLPVRYVDLPDGGGRTSVTEKDSKTATSTPVRFTADAFGFSFERPNGFDVTETLVKEEENTPENRSYMPIATYSVTSASRPNSFYKIEVYSRPEHKAIGAPWDSSVMSARNDISLNNQRTGYWHETNLLGFGPDPHVIIPLTDHYLYIYGDFVSQGPTTIVPVPEHLINFVKTFNFN